MFSIWLTSMMGSRFSQIAYKGFIQSWCRNTFKRRRIKIQRGLLVAWEVHVSRARLATLPTQSKTISSQRKPWARCAFSQSSKPLWCRSSSKKLTVGPNQSVNKQKSSNLASKRRKSSWTWRISTSFPFYSKTNKKTKSTRSQNVNAVK